MGVQIWLLKDIENILLAIQEVALSSLPTSAAQNRSMDYQQGFGAGLRSVAQSFGLKLLWLENGTLPARASFSLPDAFWLREDVEKRLLMVWTTGQVTCYDFKKNSRSAEYWQGFAAAIQCVATAFGIELLLPATSSLR